MIWLLVARSCATFPDAPGRCNESQTVDKLTSHYINISGSVGKFIASDTGTYIHPWSDMRPYSILV